MLFVICIFVHFERTRLQEIRLVTNCEFQYSNRGCIVQHEIGLNRVLEYFVDWLKNVQINIDAKSAALGFDSVDPVCDRQKRVVVPNLEAFEGG